MSSFPWESLKAETLRNICKDLGQNLGTKRKREDMVALLREVERRASLAAVEDSTSPEQTVSKAQTPPVSDHSTAIATATRGTAVAQPVTEPARHDQSEDPEGKDMDTGEDAPTCTCADGWLSPRMKFILSTVAVVASDLILDTGDTALEMGFVDGVWMTQHIPVDELPRGRKSMKPWLDGFSTLYSVIHTMFEAGRIPTLDVMEEEVGRLPMAKQKSVRAYLQYTEIEYALSGLVRQAKEEWEDEFEDTHCDEKWERLQACAEHDFDWILAEDMLAG